MGSGSSVVAANISLKFANNHSLVYQAGQLVSGEAEFLNVGQSECKLESVNIELVGELVHTTTSNRSTQVHKVPFFTKRLIVRSAKEQDAFLLEPGRHTWPFSLRLVESLPPSLEQTRYQGPFVRYVVRVLLIRSGWYRMNFVKEFPIVVQRLPSPIRANQIEDGNENRKDVHFHASLQKNVVVAGEKSSLHVNVQNPNRATITRISLCLIQERLLGHCLKDKVVLLQQNLKDIHNFQGEHLHDNFEFCVPHNVVSTCSCMPPQWPAREPLVVRYELHLEAHIQGFFTNVRLRLPLIVHSTTRTITDTISSPPSYEYLFSNSVLSLSN